MAVFSFSNSKSVINFCDNLCNPVALDAIIKENKAIGLSDTATLERELQQGNYIPVLKAVWSEQDKGKRLEWLRAKEPQLHAPLLYELGMAEFIANPLAETVNNISIPLFKAGSFRVCQDAQCSMDASVLRGDAHVRLEMVYQDRLNRKVTKELKVSLTSVVSAAIPGVLSEKVRRTAQASMERALPKPDWIGQHGISTFFGGARMCAEGEYKEKRDAFAQKILSPSQ